MCKVDTRQLQTVVVMTADGFVVEKDDYQTFILNARMTREKNIESYVHEEWHIDNEDLYKDNVQAIETEAHKHHERKEP